ncbi:hypothetical protein EW145_g2300 [Phellinidium pouzarii]|uniref:Zn(2)-C6 fungal-type domain-containing protein n=1 Tax=Phellinidium pouzarii TaxID=167371 RepID=A0A4S4LBC8_9AGAM|nr:hypothetical protein EW145_g2300 [Phellinidium pouzarii]
MEAQNDSNTRKRPYEGSSGESVSSTCFAPDSTTAGQIFVNCKRLKLKCDRKIPCGSCLKRDTVQRCIYSQAAVDKVDVQSLNIRLSIVEGKLSNVPDPSAHVPDKAQLTPSLGASLSAGKPRAFLAVGTYGASVAVNLEGAAGLWVNHLVLSGPTSRLAQSGENASMDGVELQPYPTVPEEGVIDFLTDYTPLFRVPASPTPSEDADSDSEDGEPTLHHIGISPELVLAALPSPQLRSEIYPRFEAAHIMVPCVNFYVFKQRIEDMCRWAEGPEGDYGELPPMRPSLNFFAAAIMAIALGAQCMLAERDMSLDVHPTSVSSEFSSTDTSPTTSGPSSSVLDRSMPPPPVPESPETSASHFPSPSLPSMLFRLSKLALALSMERIGYDAFDIDYVHAKALQARFLLLSHHGLGTGVNLISEASVTERKKIVKRSKGKSRIDGDGMPRDSLMADPTQYTSGRRRDKDKRRGPTLALAPEMVGIVSELVGNARMMGLNHDPDLSGGDKLSLYDKEMRRRLWWEIVSLDAFVADSLGEAPFIHYNSASTRIPSDVDDESFGPDSANLPAPNVESLQGNIDYFIQRCRLVDLLKRLGRKTSAFRELHSDSPSYETRDMLETIKIEIAQWLKDLPDLLKLKDLPSLGSLPVQMNMKGMSPPKRASAPPGDRGSSPLYDSPFLIAMRCDLAIAARHAFIMLCLPFSKDPPAETNVDDFASSSKSFDSLFMMEPAMYIVRTWQYLHSIFRYVRPSMFMCYCFTRQLFDAAVVLGHMAIQQPLYAAPALGSMRVAAEVLSDPSVLTGRPTASEQGNLPSEAVRIIEGLIAKAESALTGSPSNASLVKRKYEEVDRAETDFLYHFRFPYVGAGVVSAGPPAQSFTPAQNLLGPLVADSGSATTSRLADLSQKGNHAKPSLGDKGPVPGDPRPAMTRLKSSHPGVSIVVRHQKSKDSVRVRDSSNASTRSDTQMAIPATPPPQPSLHVVQPVQHQVTSESPSRQASYQLSASKSGSQQYLTPSGSSSTGEFSNGYRNNRYPAPAPYTHPQAFAHQNIPVSVPSQPRSFSAYAPGPQNPASQPAATHDAHPFNSTNGVEYPLTIHQHQQSEYEAMMPSMSHTPTAVTPDHHFVRGSADAGHADSQNAPMHASQPQPFHLHSQNQSQGQGQHTEPVLTPAQQSWASGPVYGPWPGYYPQ